MKPFRLAAAVYPSRQLRALFLMTVNYLQVMMQDHM